MSEVGSIEIAFLVMGLCYKSEGRGIDTDEVIVFLIDLILPTAEIRNKHYESSWEAKRGQCVRLTNTPPSVSQLCRKCEILDVSQPSRPPWPVTGIKTKLHDLSPRANYTDRATAACRRSDCQLFVDRGCHVVSVTDTYGRILGFLDRSRYYSTKCLLSCTHEAEWTPFQTHYFFSGSAENRTRGSGSVAKNSDH
jgi:hypothetical protein